MKTAYRAFGVSVALVALVLLVPNAFAATTNLSNDPAYAEGPFLFWCNPYIQSVEDGKHYKPINGPCKFSIPNTIGGNKLVGIYRGEVGNATFLTGDAVVGTPTLIQLENVSFNAVAEEEALFSVVYDSSLNQGGDLFHTYLQTGGDIPPGAVEGESYHVREWVYGSKPVDEREPVLVLPDILTTWETDEGVVIDPLFLTYQNLIDTLVANDYEPGQTLFILPYNWEDSGTSVAETLKNTIEDIKSLCNCSYIDVIAHGTAGLTAVQYTQSNDYGNDIDQLIFLGTPFNGVPGAYSAWEAGLVQFDEPVRNGIIQTLLNHKAAVNGNMSAFDYIQNKPVSSFLEMLPVSDYLSGKSYPSGYPQNSYLENIQLNFNDITAQLVQRHQFDSDSSELNTSEFFTIVPSTEPPFWPHGEVVDTQFTTGDGMVPYLSAELFASSDEFLFDVAHHDIPTDSAEYVFKALTNAEPTSVVQNNYDASCVLFLTVSQGTDLQITDPNGDRLGKNFNGSGNFAEIDRSIYSGPNFAAEYLAVANPVEGAYQVRTQGNANTSFTLTASDVCNDGTNATTTTGVIAPGQVLGYNVTVDEDDTISIQPLDTLPPNVTINTPANGTSYLTTQNVLISTTISDPEGSPIALTTYRVNGNLVNHLQPLATSSLATSTLVVAATDVFGNTGYATSTFAFRLPPPDPGPGPSTNTNCLVVLDPNDAAALKIGSSAQINFQNCGVQVNSNATGAVDISGSSKIISNKNCFVGTLKKAGSSTATPNPTIPCSSVADPYASQAEPSVGSCNFTNLAVNGSQSKTLTPGVYCGGINVSGSAQVTLNPGLYILKGGPLTVNGSAKVNGTGVSFFLTGTGAAVNLSGSAQVKLSAMTSGVLKGFVFFLDANSPHGTANSKSEFNGSSQFNFSGIVYLPTQALNIGGSANSGNPVPSSTFIVNTAYLNSSAQFKANGVAN